MVGIVAFATMMATTASGARIAAERAVGWNRQLLVDAAQLALVPRPPRC
jgi:hypothetical protein